MAFLGFLPFLIPCVSQKPAAFFHRRDPGPLKKPKLDLDVLLEFLIPYISTNPGGQKTKHPKLDGSSSGLLMLVLAFLLPISLSKPPGRTRLDSTTRRLESRVERGVRAAPPGGPGHLPRCPALARRGAPWPPAARIFLAWGSLVLLDPGTCIGNQGQPLKSQTDNWLVTYYRGS